jgi:hypothetical protein
MKVVFEAVFSMRSAPRIYHATDRVQLVQARVGAGSNTSTVTLRVVGGDEKGTQFLGVQLGQSVPGEYKFEDLDFQVGGVSNLRE